MTDRATIFQGIQLGVESTPGTGVAAGKQLLSLNLEPAIELETKTYRQVGQKFPTIVVPNKEWMSARLSGPVTYGELVYLLCGIVKSVSPTSHGTSPISYSWVFNPAQSAADTIKTFSIEQGNAVRAHKFYYGLITALNFSFSREAVELDGEMIAQRLQDAITMTATPTAVEVVPVLPTQGNLYLADTQAGLAGASALERGFNFTFNLGNRFAPIWPINTSYASFAGHVESEPTAEATLMLEADATGMGLLTQMRAGTTKWLRIKYEGATIESTYKYTLQLDVPLKISAVNSLGDQEGVYAVEYTAQAVYDATWAKPFEFTVINQVSAL